MPKKIKAGPSLLAIDVGNTYIHFALFRAGKLRVRFGVDSVLRGGSLGKTLKSVLNGLKGIDEAVICSVVPDMTSILSAVIRSELGVTARVVGRDVFVPVKNLYKNPKQVGQDRLVCAYAAAKIYGKPAIIIDLGTAITLDAVSGKDEYLGGIIVPGIQITTETLFERTALLPLVKFEVPKTLIGRDTKTSILSGIYYGYGEMIKGLISLLKKKVSSRARVIITGGHAELMSKYIKEKGSVIDRDLVMKGLVFLADKDKGTK